MEGIAATKISQIILNTPAWARLGLAASDVRLRERAADTIAAIVAARLAEADAVHDERQLPLPML